MKRREINGQLILIITGFFIGILYTVLSKGDLTGFSDYMGEKNLIEVSFCHINTSHYLLYLLKRRGMLVGIMLLALFSYASIYLVSLLLVLLGFGLSTMFLFLVMNYKIKGILFFIAFFFPQILFYGPVLSEFFQGLLQLSLEKREHNHDRNQTAVKHISLKKVGKLFIVSIIGMLTECYVNPIIVKIILKII